MRRSNASLCTCEHTGERANGALNVEKQSLVEELNLLMEKVGGWLMSDGKGVMDVAGHCHEEAI